MPQRFRDLLPSDAPCSRQQNGIELPSGGGFITFIDMKRGAHKRDGNGLRLVCESRGGEPYEYYPLGRFVVIAPGVCGSRPTFKGTRVEVQTVLDWLRAGRTIRDILESYPSITRAGVREAIRLASRALREHCSRQAA